MDAGEALTFRLTGIIRAVSVISRARLPSSQRNIAQTAPRAAYRRCCASGHPLDIGPPANEIAIISQHHANAAGSWVKR